MKKTLSSLILAASVTLFPLALSAAPPPVKFSFEAVDEVGYDGFNLDVEGLLEGSTGTTRVTLSSSLFVPENLIEACLKMAQLAQARPGRYLFQVSAHPDEPSNFGHCRLRSR